MGYFLLGAVPVELHKRQLSLLYNVVKSNDQCLSRPCWMQLRQFAGLFLRDRIDSIRFLEYSPRRVGTTHLLWRNSDTSKEVSVVLGFLQVPTPYSHPNTPTVKGSLHCQLEDEDIRHLVCRCPAFYEYRQTAHRQIQEIVTHFSD